MTFITTSPAWFRQWQLGLLAVGGIGLTICGLGGSNNQLDFLYAWLIGYLVVWEASVGCLSILMLYHLTDGRWGRAARPALETGASLLPIVALGFLPIGFQTDSLYSWAGDQAATDPLIASKAAYLNVGDFRLRALIYFAVLIICYLLLVWPGRRKDTSDEHQFLYPRRGAIGLILLIIISTFAAIDWAMSLEPHWFSSMYGAVYVVSSATVAMALSVFAVSMFPQAAVVAGSSSATVRGDMGSLLLAMLMVWAYFSFSQFLIIWSANLPEENIWYLSRAKGGWQYFTLLIVLVGFVIPFFALLSIEVKRHPRRLAVVAGMIVLAQILHIFWMVAPARYSAVSEVPWQIPVTIVAMPSLWLGLWLSLLQRKLTS